jgi:tungstate transport system permease protein
MLAQWRVFSVELLDSSFWRIVSVSLFVSGTAVIAASLVGIPMGVWLGLSKGRRTMVLRGLVQTGMALPPVVVGLILYMLLSRSGPLASLGWLYTAKAMVLAQFCLAIPFVVGITMTSVASVPGELIPQIRSLGATETQVRWTVLREAQHGVLLAVAAAFGRSISEVGAVLIVGGNILGHTRVLTTAIVLETSKGEFGVALALSAALLTLAMLVNFAIMRVHAGRAFL